jgi:uncharacterized protein YebE (UPF0316 family)
MDLFGDLPTWAMALVIFLLRVVDVSMATCRTIAVVQGRVFMSVAIGFVEVLVWVTTVAQVLQHASNNPILLFAFAGGFAAGNGAGIVLERWLAMGGVILRIVSLHAGHELAEVLRDYSPRVFLFEGYDNGEEMTLLYVVVRRRDAPRIVRQALAIDPQLFYAVDTLRESNMALGPATSFAGQRLIFKAK